jgi:molybdenum cofactor sulfurtransferase
MLDISHSNKTTQKTTKMDEFCNYREIYSPEQRKLISIEFQRVEGQHYLEHAGATLYSEKQLQEIARQLCNNLYANPHARNLSSKLTEDAVDIVRYEILTHFKTNPQEYSVIFTSGTTAALKLIAESFSYGSDCGTNGRFVYLQDNHTSVLGMRAYAKAMKCITFDDAFNALSCDTGSGEGKDDCNSLFVFPAQSNFSGVKYPVAWIERVQRGALNRLLEQDCRNWFVALDASSYVATNELDLSTIKPDFVTISFYKIFGYPTGLGALLVRNSSCHVLKKRYFGGGTVLMAQTLENTAVLRDVVHERFEDGTVPFLSILALKEGFNTIKRLNLTFDLISKHTFSLAQYVYRNLLCLHHANGRPVVVLYHDTPFENLCDQGAIVNFNVLRDDGEHVGYAEVLHFANLYGIHLRTGCFCNPGACQYFLKLSPEDVKRHFNAGHVCGDQHDLVDGCPTGSVRISFGYMSTKKDADQLLEMIDNCFVSKPAIRRIPQRYSVWREKYQNYFVTKNNQPINTDAKKSQECNNNSSLSVRDHFINNRNSEGVLQQIVLYPIKSCGGFTVLDKWPITSTGLKYDRQWMLINTSGVCITQKNNKLMCLIRPKIDLETKMLILSYAKHKRICVPISAGTKCENLASLCQSKVCGDKIQGWDCGDEVADWLSEVLNCPGVRLLRQCSEDEYVSRISKQNELLHLSLANKAQYLLINVASVEWLRKRIPGDEFEETLETTIQRFRPNLVVKFDNAYVENYCEKFIFEDVSFETGGLCTRCQMICIDQTTGKTSKEPLQTLSKSFKGKISFGTYLNRLENVSDECLHVGCTVKGIGIK